MNPFRNNIVALAKGASSGEVPVPGSIPRSPCQGRLCRAPCPHPRLRQLGRSCSGCRLAAGSCLSPATAKPAWNILLANPPLCRSLPREGRRAGEAALPGSLPAGARGGSPRSLSRETPLKPLLRLFPRECLHPGWDLPPHRVIPVQGTSGWRGWVGPRCWPCGAAVRQSLEGPNLGPAQIPRVPSVAPRRGPGRLPVAVRAK